MNPFDSVNGFCEIINSSSNYKAKFDCSEEILQILSMLQIQNVFVVHPITGSQLYVCIFLQYIALVKHLNMNYNKTKF